MSDSLKKRGEALEESYFKKVNDAALERLSARESEAPRLSPIDGQPMIQTTYMGVNIDVCKTSGGIFLDKGELEAIVEHIRQTDSEHYSSFFSGLFGKKQP